MMTDGAKKIVHEKIVKKMTLALFLLVVAAGFSKIDLIGEEKEAFVFKSNCQEKNEINIWYGPVQRFGQHGRPQRWVNVLGNVCNSDRIKSLEYELNHNTLKELTLGSDSHRLALEGDFNVELAWDELDVGKNNLTIIKTYQNGEVYTSEIVLIIEQEKNWPLPYSVDFTQIESVQQNVQVVDGLWGITPQGLRTKESYYDRVVTMGDTTWQNYEATVRLTIHDFTASTPGPPTYNVTHFGMAFRWRGHTRDGLQPSRQWYPLGAQGEFLLKEDKRSGTWRILFGYGDDSPKPEYADEMNSIQLGKEMIIKGRVRTMEDGRTRYRYKQWMAESDEPDEWDVEGFDEMNDYSSGALCLVPHNSDITLHQVLIEPLY